jgi:nitrate/nitrite transport system permease protein
MHASMRPFSPGARRAGSAIAAKAGAPTGSREAANDTTRPAAPVPVAQRVLRLTPEEQHRELQRAELRTWLARLFAPVLGLVLFGLLWQLIAHTSGQLPTPARVWHAATTIFSDPFYRNGPNDQGIGWNVLSSLKRVGLGFGLAAVVGIPLGFVIGRFKFFNQMAAPLISLLKPVSPLAWLPIGLLLFKAANPAAVWTIFICSLWPMIINTAVGVRQIPHEYLNVAKVLQLSEWKVLTRILFPAVLPYMLTGVRLSIGIAWLVIVAAEMLTGGVGIGFWVWDEWNNLNVQHIIIAIVVIGVVGMLLEAALILLARRFEYQ